MLYNNEFGLVKFDLTFYALFVTWLIQAQSFSEHLQAIKDRFLSDDTFICCNILQLDNSSNFMFFM